jgi:hypothetical protein
MVIMCDDGASGRRQQLHPVAECTFTFSSD